jgi:endoglucanase
LEIKDLLARMNEVPHVSGYEGELAEMLAGEFSQFTDDVTIDKLGSVIAHKKGTGNGPRVMFIAHMDEIGLMVNVLCDKGFVKFTPIGGIDARNILAQEVIIHGREKVYGVIGIKPPHLTAPGEQKKTVQLHDMIIDTGYSKEALEKLVKPGDIITFKQGIAELKNGKLSGRAFDDIAGIAAMYCAMKNLRNFNQDADVYFVASAQEEVGCRGGTTASYSIKPDIGIAIDVTFGRTAGLGEHESYPLGKGPTIEIAPGMSRRLFEDLKNVAVKNNIPYQISVSSNSQGTDAYVMQVTEGGIFTGLLGIPLKYMHSTVETLSLRDIELTGRLMSDYIISLNDCEKEGEECFWKN